MGSSHDFLPAQKPSVASQAATQIRCSSLNTNCSFIFLFHYLPLFKLAYILSPLYGPCFPAPMPLLTLFLPRLMPCSVSIKIFQRLTYKGLFKSHLLNDVSLLPWSKNNISPIPTPIPLGWHYFSKINSCSCAITIFLNCIPLGKCENAYVISVSSKALAQGLASKQEIRYLKKNCELEKRIKTSNWWVH